VNTCRVYMVVILATVILACGWIDPACAVNNKIWEVSADGDWDTASNWSPDGYPTSNDNAMIGVTGHGMGRTVTLNSARDCYALLVGYNQSESDIDGYLDMGADGDLVAYNASYVGYAGDGWMRQRSAGNTVDFDGGLVIAQEATSSGYYYLEGGNLDSPWTYVGVDGDGYFTHSSGTHNATSFVSIGSHSGSNGMYDMSGGVLNTGILYVAQLANGTFTQSGTADVNPSSSVLMAEYAGSLSEYHMNGGTLDTPHIYLGYASTATFTQTDGTVSVNAALHIATQADSEGTFNLNGGELISAGNISGGAGNSYLNIDGGTLTFNGSTIDVTGFALGRGTDTTGSFTLSNGKTLTVSADMVLGDGGSGTFTQNGGDVNVETNMLMAVSAGKTGDYVLNAGTLDITGSIALGIEGTGTFTQDGGDVTIGDQIFIADSAGSTGTYSLSAGTLAVTESIRVGYYGASGTFTQTGGSVTTINGDISIGVDTSASGEYTLVDGTIIVGANMHVGNFGTAVFTQSGGTSTITNTIYIAEASGSNGTYNMQGGVLNANTIHFVDGTGEFNFTGGTLHVVNYNGTLHQEGTSTLAPGSSPGITNISGDYLLDAGSFLALDIWGETPESEYDVVYVTGNATLDGTILIDLGSFVPPEESYFDVLHAAEITIGGNFSVPAGWTYSIEPGSDILRLSMNGSSVPELPAGTAALLSMLAGILIVCGRKIRLRYIVVFIMAAGILLFGAPATHADTYSATVMADNPLAYWRFGESGGSTAYDASGNNLNATYSGVTLGEAGIISGNTAILFNPAEGDVVRYTASGLYPGTGSWTMEVWTKIPATISNTGVIICYSPGGYAFGLPSSYVMNVGASGIPSIWIRDVNSNSLGISASSGIADDEWHHLVGVIDRTNNMLNLYVDGELANSGSIASLGSINDGAYPVDMGMRYTFYSGWLEPFKGTMDEMAIYNSALSSSDITQHYLAGTGAVPELPAGAAAVLSLLAGAWMVVGKRIKCQVPCIK